ncbi:MAG: hypothetical protein IIB27_03775 [Chloroflexi bacterium]|nr:hypothetical protein [Chloroflexota bacterium]MCH8817215.1 hypothetical protein [Chloroflexota bacterium]
MNRTKNLGLGLGLTALMVIGLACGSGETQEPASTGPTSDSPQAQTQGQSRSPDPDGENTAPDTPRGTPLVSLSYEGAVYYLTPLGTGETANLNEVNLELVGATTESNLIAPGSGKSLEIYRLKDGEEFYIYTLAPGGSFQIEDGNTVTTETFEAEWMRWTAAESN